MLEDKKLSSILHFSEVIRSLDSFIAFMLWLERALWISLGTFAEHGRYFPSSRFFSNHRIAVLFCFCAASFAFYFRSDDLGVAVNLPVVV
jgi:hypothetical protein